MGQNQVQRKTQTVTHTPIGHNGADSMGRLTLRWKLRILSRIWPRYRNFSEANGKNVGEQIASARVFYLFYLRLVQLPHQLMKGEPSSRWWVEQNGAGRSGRENPIRSAYLPLRQWVCFISHSLRSLL